jgi:hypothetical protein
MESSWSEPPREPSSTPRHVWTLRPSGKSPLPSRQPGSEAHRRITRRRLLPAWRQNLRTESIVSMLWPRCRLLSRGSCQELSELSLTSTRYVGSERGERNDTIANMYRSSAKRELSQLKSATRSSAKKENYLRRRLLSTTSRYPTLIGSNERVFLLMWHTN